MGDNMDCRVEFDVEQAARCFSAWQRLHSPPSLEDQLTEWRDFFSSWESLVPAVLTLEKKPLFDCEKFVSFVQEFTKPYEEYRRSGATVNVWRAAGLKHDELRNSQVLSWILDRFGDHGHGSAILERLVELAGKQRLVGKAAEEIKKITAEMVRENNYWTRIESLPLGDIESRIDIEIESAAFLVFIEVKVRAAETNDQLKRYVDLAPKKAAGRPWAIIFLTTDGRPPNNTELHNEVIPIKWKQIASILVAHTTGELGNSFSGRIFRQFADHARHLA